MAPNETVGADGLTNSQWLQSSSPGNSGLAGEYRKENREKEGEKDTHEDDTAWSTSDSNTIESFTNALATGGNWEGGFNGSSWDPIIYEGSIYMPLYKKDLDAMYGVKDY